MEKIILSIVLIQKATFVLHLISTQTGFLYVLIFSKHFMLLGLSFLILVIESIIVILLVY